MSTLNARSKALLQNPMARCNLMSLHKGEVVDAVSTPAKMSLGMGSLEFHRVEISALMHIDLYNPYVLSVEDYY